MHQFISALFAILLSFCHHSGSSHAMEANVSYQDTHPTPVLSFPDRQDLARSGAETGYAGGACLSCQTMSVSFIAR